MLSGGLCDNACIANTAPVKTGTDIEEEKMSHAPANFTVWTEIPVSDLNASIQFYNAVFDIDLAIDNTGPNPMAMFPTKDGKGVAGHLYPGTPANDGTGPTVHMLCPVSVEEGIERVKKAGGKPLSPVIDIPVGRFAYCLDPDGNSIGLFTYMG